MQEQQLKIGDWVVNSDNEVFQLEDIHMWQDLSTLFTPWQPMRNEVCWLYNDNETLEDLVLSRFFNKVGNYHYGFTMNGQELSGYRYCQPFIGSLPTPLQ